MSRRLKLIKALSSGYYFAMEKYHLIEQVIHAIDADKFYEDVAHKRYPKDIELRNTFLRGISDFYKEHR